MAKQKSVKKNRKQNMPKAGRAVKTWKDAMFSKFQRIRLIRRVTLATLLLVVFIGLWWIISRCTVTTVYVDGNIHYTNDEITAMVTEGRFGKNTLYLFAKHRNTEIKEAPLIETTSKTNK